MNPKKFIFEDFDFNVETKTLKLTYSFDGALKFQESFFFDFDFIMLNQEIIDRLASHIFFVAGVSYFKAFAPNTIEIKKGMIDQNLASFLSKTYQKGLGEFFFVNQLDPRTKIDFPVNSKPLPKIEFDNKGKLVGIGGGKDSLTTVEMLRSQKIDFSTWSLSHRNILEPLINKIGSKHLYVDRSIDLEGLHEAKKHGGMNGHIPISAIFGVVGTFVAYLSGNQDNIVSNEHSANEPSLEYEGIEINHQYSKSSEFEQSYQKLLKADFDDNLRYYSFLRSITEVRIAEIFASLGFEKYKETFSSCNRAFVHGSTHMNWCGECPKCAFVFLAMTPFIKREELEKLMHGKNLLLDHTLEPTYRKLLGIDKGKPLDCVGEIKEARAAMSLAFNSYPELKSKYDFYLPKNYHYADEYPNDLPAEINDIFKKSTAKIPPRYAQR